MTRLPRSPSLSYPRGDPSLRAPMPTFHRVCLVSEVPEHLPRHVRVDGVGVLICRYEGGLFALTELCPHKQESMRYGVVMDGKLICPSHTYGFDLSTGRCDKRRQAPAQTYPLEVRGEEVWVEV